jgi:hypothetical protein
MTFSISSQLYDDPFRFFYELIQNADDAEYESSEKPPAMIVRVERDELTIDKS